MERNPNMATFEHMKEYAHSLNTTINEILEMENDELYGANRLHQLSFNKYGKEQFQMVFDLIRKLEKCQFERIPGYYISQLQSQLNTYKELFERAKNLTLDAGDIKNNRDQIVNEVESNYESLFNAVSPVINFANQAGTDFQQIEKEAKNILKKVKDYFNEQKTQMNKSKEEVDSILESIKEASAEAGVSQQAIHFSKAQEHHAENARKWHKWGRRLLFALGSTILVICGLIFFFKEDTSFKMGYLEYTTLIIISLWVYAINFCNKNFHAEKHNEVSNANKSKNLATFRSFVDATDDKHIKDRVLIQASTSIFSNPSTGFGKNQSGPLPLPVEIGKSLVDRPD